MERKPLLETVMEACDMNEQEAKEAIGNCRAELMERLAEGEMPFDILEEHFGIEPDWLDELM